MEKAIVTVLLVALATAGAAAGPVASRMIGDVRVELILNRSVYELGDTVEITLTLANQGMEVSDFQFPTGQMYDFIVVHGDQRIWQWSRGRLFTQAFTTLVLKPGESRTFHERWNLRNGQDRQVPSGEYEIVAVFPAQGGRVPSTLDGPHVRFRIGVAAQATKPDVTSRAVAVGGRHVGEVVFDSRPVLRLRVAAGGISAVERAAVVANRLRRFLEEGLKPQDLTVSRLGTDAVIMWRSRLLVTADAHHARLNRTSPRALALQWRQSLVRALSIRQ